MGKCRQDARSSRSGGAWSMRVVSGCSATPRSPGAIRPPNSMAARPAARAPSKRRRRDRLPCVARRRERRADVADESLSTCRIFSSALRRPAVECRQSPFARAGGLMRAQRAPPALECLRRRRRYYCFRPRAAAERIAAIAASTACRSRRSAPLRKDPARVRTSTARLSPPCASYDHFA